MRLSRLISLKTFLLTLLIIISYHSIYAQQTFLQITGTVIDAKTRAPLAGASVYLDHTTKATITSDSGKFVLKNIPSGNYNLIISYVGYHPVSVPMSEQYNPPLKVELSQTTKSLKEVVITADPHWEEYYSLFKMFFLGKTDQQCTIENPKALSFHYNDTSYVLTAETSEPLIIDNKALGYKVYYDLSYFIHYASRTSYSGYTRFEETTSTDSKELKRWKTNREKAYYGSLTHFMHSLVNKQLTEDGFVVKKLEKVKTINAFPTHPILENWKGNEFKSSDTIITMRWNGRDYAPEDTTVFSQATKPSNTLNPTNTPSPGNLSKWGQKTGYNILYPGNVPYNNIITPTSLSGNYKLSFNNSLFITYKKKKSDGNFTTSILTMLIPETFVDTHGNLADQHAVINEGYWATLRVADQLPFDYAPFP
ncbi:carboxypeptidase-like regulatory domain-containing protein [Pedobacter foliorum]|uniref:carboxypeptidase-like regulatory domain-containing protein n=1 Tax=Pedobacter foliorum TaxID=2739058 RepID=UPI001567AAC1|nr:carboxypeptidase-like regulatory domain-containing protein [Pedobacter foliorum]NRF38176.1 carboxypeptidase-like regulatory domain-containing protein [Pedobacter foliorum]